MRSLSLLLLCLFLSLFIFNAKVVLAQDDDIDIEVYDDEDVDGDDDEYYEEDDDEDDGGVGENSDVITGHIFPRLEDNNIKGGDVIESLVSFQNDADEPFNITSIGGAFVSIYDSEFYIQNFTAQPYGIVVPTATELSFTYFYRVGDLESADVNLQLWVNYNDSFGKTYRNTVVNTTVTLSEADAEFDTMTFLTFLATLAGVFFVTKVLSPETISAYTTPVERGTATAEDWDVKVYQPKTNAATTSKKKRSKKGKKGGKK
jgi:hypothetical protein